MAKQRRVFNSYPPNQQTPQNDRETFVADDPLFEPEEAGFLGGFIGDTSILTEEDLERTPPIVEMTPERQKYQLTIGAVFVDPITQVRSGGAFYTDLVQNIESNGGIVDDPNRIFSTRFYTWSPPIDFDKHINFSRYRWTGDGTADVNGEYITKEASHSKTTLYELTDLSTSTLEKRDVTIVNGLPAVGPVGTLVEDASTTDRTIYQSDGAAWVLLFFRTIPNITNPDLGPNPFEGDFYYIAKTGPEFNRPLVWLYRDDADRWLPQPVVVDFATPDRPRENMVWEDARLFPTRVLKIFENGVFVDLVYTPADGPPGAAGTDGEYLYDTRNYADITDGWVANNWWRHFEDLSPVDRDERTNQDQAIRPIIEFWNGIEPIAGDQRDFRNDIPVFKKFSYDSVADEITDTGESTTIYQYQVGIGEDDFVLGFPVVLNQTGEFVFDLTLETDTSEFLGYKYFKDGNTNLTSSVWQKADEFTMQEQDADGLYEVPLGIESNPDHGLLTVFSRSKILTHMGSVMSAQETFSGDQFGLNSYRWTKKDTTLGAILVDGEQTNFRALALLQNSLTDMPDSIRKMAKEYNKTLSRFVNKLNRFWEDALINTPEGTLTTLPSEATDAILTELFVGRTEDFPFFLSDMGTYITTTVVNGMANPVDPNSPRPIFIAPSAPRVGASPCFVPEEFTDIDGDKLRGHEGSIIPSFGDDRDLVWLDLQNRFFDATPVEYCTETAGFSSRFADSNFQLDNFFGNLVPITTIEPVDDVVEDFNAIAAPAAGLRVFSTIQGFFANFDGQTWLTRQAIVDDIFQNLDDGEFYIFNGIGTFIIQRFNRPFAFDYTDNEFRIIIRREFERFIVFREQDFSENTTFDINDPFTWNYRSAGIEGHYQGIYRRVYNTVRPHSHAWEVMGYKVEPDWWRTQYVPDSTASDGTPRYGSAHPMWADFALGFVDNPVTPFQRNDLILTGPIPVDVLGELLDPIAAGVVIEDSLDKQRIDDFWVYGDGAPVEQEFLNSSFFSFAIALGGYLMKNGLWLDTLWTEVYINIGSTGACPISTAPHVVHRDTLTRPSISELLLHLEIDENGNRVQRLGVNAWVAEKINTEAGAPSLDFGQVVRNTQPALGWKTSGFISHPRTDIFTLSNNQIPFEDVHVILYQSQPIEQKFCSGVIIARESTGQGYRVFGTDPTNPFFTVERPAVPIAGGQVELRQEFTVEFIDQDANNVTGGAVFPDSKVNREFQVTEFNIPNNKLNNDTAKLAVIVNGLRMKPQHITITDTNSVIIEDFIELEPGDIVSVNVLTTQSSPSTRLKQFFVDGVSFPYFSEGTGEFDRIEYGRFFDTSTEVINFLVGYGRFLTKDGWVFDSLSEGNEIRDWLLGARRFAKWTLDVESPWNRNKQVDLLDEGFFLYSPTENIVEFVSEFGQTTNLESIMNGSFGILNQRSEPIPVEETFVARIDGQLTVQRTDQTNEDTRIFGTRVNITENEHVAFFSNVTRFNDIIYDPILGLFNETLRVDTLRTLNWKGRIEANGFLIVGGALLPNFEKQAKDITRLYDRFNPVDDPLKRGLSRNLVGYSPPNPTRFRSLQDSEKFDGRTTFDSLNFLIPVGADDRTRFDYFRGMLQTKGTMRPIFAFSRGTTLGVENTDIFEEWAWKIQQFGDPRRDIIQFRVDKNDFVDETQVVAFQEIDDPSDRTISIAAFSRSDPDANPRWIMPPVLGKNLICNVKFPTDLNNLPDVENYEFLSKLFDEVTGITVLTHTNFDPEVGKFDSLGNCLLDLEQEIDPARYNTGPDVIFSDELCWASKQVGMYWWNTARRKYVDYRSRIFSNPAPNSEYEDASRFWGDLLSFKTIITRTDEIVTITTLDSFGSGAIVPHGIPIGETVPVDIFGAEQEEYNTLQQLVTATTTTQLEYEIDFQPASPATGDPQILVGFVDILEWVESPVPPSEWENFISTLEGEDAPTGAVFNAEDPSYTQITSTGPSAVSETKFFFWIVNNSGTNSKKNLTADQVSNRLADPTTQGIPWFAIVDDNHMIVFTDGEIVQDGYAIEVITDQRDLETHFAWQLVSEKDNFISVPQSIVDKLIDSMSQIDKQGSVVPSPTLSESEKFGSCFFPPQTVFRDIDSALGVYIEAINLIFRSKNLSLSDTPFLDIFDLADELSDSNPTGYWQRTAFIEDEFANKVVFDTVPTIADRDFRASQGFYVEGDLVKVNESGETDPWTGLETPATYVLSDESTLAFGLIGIDSDTASINTNIVLDTTNFRRVYFDTYDEFEKIEQNNMVFSLIHEMNVQSINQDWMIKTSYINGHFSVSTNQSPFVRPNEVQAIIDNIQEIKPFRTKMRGHNLTLDIGEVEPFTTQLIEFPDKKISLFFDRLSCSAFEDGGWESFPWDSQEVPGIGWDKPFWEFDDLGRQEFYTVASFIGDGVTTQYVADALFTPIQYNTRVVVSINGDEVDLDEVGVNFTIEETTTQIIVTFLNAVFGATTTIEIQQAQGFFDGPEPTLGPDLENTIFQPAPGTYEHAIARILDIGVEQPFDVSTVMDGCDIDSLGGAPEERLNNEVCDSVNICVITDHTPAYAGWDAQPWDSTPWDSTPADVGRRVFIISAGKQEICPPGVQFFNTSDDVRIGGELLVFNDINGAVEGTPAVSDVIMRYMSPREAIIRAGFTGAAATEEIVLATAIDSVYEIRVNTVAIGTITFPATASTGFNSGSFADVIIGDHAIQFGDVVEVVATIVDPDHQNMAFTIPFWNLGLITFSTSVIGPSPSFVIEQIEVQTNGVGAFVIQTEGVEYEVGALPHILEFNTPDIICITADGITTSYDTQSPTCILNVWVEGTLMAEGVDFNFADPPNNTIIDFVQPPPNTVDNFNFPASISDVGDGMTVDYEINQDRQALIEENVFIFSDGDLQDISTYIAGSSTDDITIIDGTKIVSIIDVGGNTARATTAFPHVAVVGNSVEIQGVNVGTPGQDEFAGTKIITAVPSTTTFEYAIVSATADASAVPFLAMQFDFSTTIVRVKLATNGNVPDVADGAVPTSALFSIIAQGTALSPETTYIDFTGVTGATLPTGAVPAAYFDIDSTTTAYRLWFNDTVTAVPPAAGRTLVSVSFSAADTNQLISNAVVTAFLSSGDTDFVGVTNNSAFGEGTQILIHGFGNSVQDRSPIFDVQTFVATPAQTLFNTGSGFGDSDRTFVFVDSGAGRRYQVLTTDYTVPGFGLVDFVVPFAGGETVEIRTLISSSADLEHITFSSSGTTSDPIPGLSDADDPTLYMVFRGDTIQDGYTSIGTPDFTIINGIPDIIDWTDLPETTALDFTAIDGPSLPTGVVSAAWFDISSTTATYRFWFDDGSTIVPPAGGNVLTAIPFVGTETNQGIADLVVAALIGADADFAGASNISQLINLELATVGIDVPDSVDGFVPTGASIAKIFDGAGAFGEISKFNFFGITGATLPTGAVPAALFEVSSTTATYRFWFDDGSTIAPTFTFQVLQAVAFTAADTDQDISDAVIAAFAATADADFAGASNGTPVVNVTLATNGVVPDAIDGTFPDGTGADIDVVIQGTDIPGVGEDISVRYIREARVSQTSIIKIFPEVDDEIKAEPIPYIQPNDVVRYRYSGWPVGPEGGFRYNGAIPSPATTYDTIRGIISFDVLPDPLSLFVLEFTTERAGEVPRSILVRMPIIVNDILPDHTVYDDPTGFNTFRTVGTIIVNTTSERYFEWDGTVWNDTGGVNPGDQFFVTRKQQIWEFTGVFTKLFDVGDSFTMPPVIELEKFGLGITYGMYSLGQLPNAEVSYPSSYQIMQHPGDCPA